MKKVMLGLCLLCLVGFTNKVNTPLNKENLWTEINNAGIKYPEVVFAQAILESGELKSKLTKNNNNLFGMKIPGKRETLAIGEKYGHAKYSSWQESVWDYKLYQDYIIEKKKITTYKTYVSHLNKTYAEVGDYFKRLTRVMKEHKQLINDYKSI